MFATVRRTRIMLAVMVAATIPAVGPPADASQAPLAVGAVGGIAPSLDVPAPVMRDVLTNERLGARASRFELDDPARMSGMSVWYRLSYVAPGDRLQVFEHNPATTRGPDSRIARALNVAWHVATTLLGQGGGVAEPGEIPDWARPRTGTANGPSGGLISALADLDLLTPGPLAGALRVAGTGAIASDGAVLPVRLLEAKLAAARLADVDVSFAPEVPDVSQPVTVVPAGPGTPKPDRPLGDWLNTAGYEHAGRVAATRSGRPALVVVHDIRQALAWLCGRTDLPATCALAHVADTLLIADARPYTARQSNDPRSDSPNPGTAR